jgi:hypothetical protein
VKANPFRRGKHRQTPAELRADNERLTGELAETRAELAGARQELADRTEERDWFHDHWIEAGEHAAEAEIVVGCLTKQLEAERRKVADLEAIAGPHRPSADEPSPIYTEVTGEHPLPDFTETKPAADAEATVQLPAVKTLAGALGGAA